MQQDHTSLHWVLPPPTLQAAWQPPTDLVLCALDLRHRFHLLPRRAAPAVGSVRLHQRLLVPAAGRATGGLLDAGLSLPLSLLRAGKRHQPSRAGASFDACPFRNPRQPAGAHLRRDSCARSRPSARSSLLLQGWEGQCKWLVSYCLKSSMGLGRRARDAQHSCPTASSH